MNKIDVVITMGGLGSRFRKAGYTIPKYMIEAKGRTLFEWSLESLEGFKSDVNQFIFIAMENESADVEAFIREKCTSLGIDNFKILIIDYLTDGQATTALLAKKYWNVENALLIYNIDTYVERGAMNSGQIKGDGFIPCFKAAGTHWSFVRLNEQGQAVEIKEKERISDNCTLGAYYFKTCSLYEKLYEDYYGVDGKSRGVEKNLVNGEKYVAPLYNRLLENGGEIYIADIPSEKVHVLGTPEELQAFVAVHEGRRA